MRVTRNYIVKKKPYKLYHTVYCTKISWTVYRKKISWIEKLEDYLKKSIKDLKTAFPIIIALSSSLIYFMVYFYNFIYFRYYSIDTIYYNPSIQQILSSLVVCFLVFIVLCFIVFYRYVQNKHKEKTKILIRIKDFLCYASLLFIFTIVEGFLLIENFTINQLPVQYVINYMLCVIIYRCIYNYFNKRGNIYGLKLELQESAKEKGGILINFIVIIVSVIVTIGINGCANIIGKKSFKIIYRKEMFILERQENVSVECEIILYCNNTLCVTTKGKIEKNAGKYKLYFKDINQKNNIVMTDLSYKKYRFDYVQKLRTFIFI